MKQSKACTVLAYLLGVALLLAFSVGGGGAVDTLYKNPNRPMKVRIKNLMEQMTLEEKIGQMAQLERSVATPEIMKNFSIGSLLSGGGSVPREQATAEEWVDMVNMFQNGSMSSRLGIPMIYGIDAVHGHNNVYRATIFPHNVGLGVTRYRIILSASIITPLFKL